MEKFIVADRTINRVLSWLAINEASTIRFNHEDEGGLTTLGTSMLEMNCEAFDSLYGSGEATEFKPLDYEFRWDRTSEVQVLKSLQCWLDQCSNETVAENDLYRQLKVIESKLALRVVANLECYATAEWG